MVSEHALEEHRQIFFNQGYASHLPGYTGHCPTLKFQVGKRFGASTKEILKEMLEKKVLKTGPYRPTVNEQKFNSHEGKNVIRRDYKNEAQLYKFPPYILGYTGYIPGFNSKFGLPFMKAVEEGAREWRETQHKLMTRQGTMEAYAKQFDPASMLSRVKPEEMTREIANSEVDRGYKKQTKRFDNRVSPEQPPIVGYTGHIPGSKGDTALSKRYTQAAKKGLELIWKDRKEHQEAKEI